MKNLTVSACFLLLFLTCVTAQELFPEAHGAALLDSLVKNYKPAAVLGYDAARDKMYALIDNRNDSVTCVYTGYRVYVPYNDPDPRSYTNTPKPIMNAEHTWPTGKGATGNASSDLHHLYATNEYANSARGSLPFDAIPDQQTNRWWRGVSYITTIPAVQKELYSREQTGIRFQPKADHRGNVARSMFYFYTMYKAEADAKDPVFFALQKDVLKIWHQDDPVDARELERTGMIAAYQDGKPNPFILDSTLVRRCYFTVSGLAPQQELQSGLRNFILEQNYPNPFNNSTRIGFSITQPSRVRLEIYDLRGIRIAAPFEGDATAGNHQVHWTAGPEISSGVYYYRLYLDGTAQNIRTRKMILVK